MSQKVVDKLKHFIFSPSFLPVFIITFFTFASRGLGFVKQFLILEKLSKLEADLLLNSVKIPDFLATFLLMGTVYSSILPIASKLETDDPSNLKTSKYLNLILVLLSIVIFVFSLLVVTFTEPILRFITSSEQWQEIIARGYLSQYILSTRILCLMPLASATQAILGIFITIKKRFLVYSLAGLAYNLGYIFGIIFSNGNFVNVAIGMICGWLLADLLFLWEAYRFGYLLPSLSKAKKSLYSIWNFRTYFKEFLPELKQSWKLFLPRIFLLDGFYIANFLIAPLAQENGQITAFDVAVSISGSFLIIVTALGTVFFPDLSKTFHDSSQKDQFWHKLKKYLLIAFGLGLLVCVAGIIGSPLIMWLYSQLGRGQGTTKYIIKLAQIASISLIFHSIHEILSKYFFVKQRQWQPVLLSLFGVFWQMILIFVMYKAGLDVGIIMAISLIVYHLAWSLLACFWVFKDFRKWQIEKID